MELLISADAASVAEALVTQLHRLLEEKPDAVIGLATGRTPMLAYSLLARDQYLGPDLSQAKFVMLDEYLGLQHGSPDTYRRVLEDRVLTPLGLDQEQLISFNSATTNAEEDAALFEQQLATIGGVDLQILGIGRNGHIGFNEPGSSFDSRTRRVQLSEITRQDNAATLVSESVVPREAITQGIGTILQAKRIALIATGAAKNAILQEAIYGPSSSELPASALRDHPDCVFIVDQLAQPS
jgi:glucosamine-6-phosphate deaminase